MSPMPEPEHIHFILKWWQEFLAGTIMIFLGLYARSKGREKEASVIIPLSEEHIDNKIKISQQDILLKMHDMLKDQEESIIARVKDLLP